MNSSVYNEKLNFFNSKKQKMSPQLKKIDNSEGALYHNKNDISPRLMNDPVRYHGIKRTQKGWG